MVCIADVNADARPDLVVVTEVQGVKQFLSRVSEITNIAEAKKKVAVGGPVSDNLKKVKLKEYKKHPKKD